MSGVLSILGGTFLTLELCWGVFIMTVKTKGLGTDLQSVSAPSLG